MKKITGIKILGTMLLATSATMMAMEAEQSHQALAQSAARRLLNNPSSSQAEIADILRLSKVHYDQIKKTTGMLLSTLPIHVIVTC